MIKKQYYRIFGIVSISLLLILAACEPEFLKQDPQTSLSTEQLFESLDNVQPFLNGLYFKWRSTRVNRKGFFLMLGTDESQQGEYQVATDAPQAGLDKYNGFLDPENKPVAELWNIRWPIVVQASEAIWHLESKLPFASSDDSLKINNYLGQAHFYKAAVLFELASYWGGLPMPSIDNGDIILSGRKSAAEVYGIIEESFLTAIDLLDEKPANDPRIPTTWAARALLGKLYMSADEATGYRDFNLARDQFNYIRDFGGFDLVNNFADLWDPDKNTSKEQIYTFLFNNIWPDTNEAQWYTGSRACSGNPTNAIGGYDLVLPTVYSRTDISTGGLWEEGDLRKMESIRYNFVNGDMTPSVYAGFGEDQLLPHIKKYEDFRINGLESFYYSGKNMYYVRYADVLLSLAECLNEAGQTSDAVDIVNNEIRNRAWGGTLPEEARWNAGMSQEEFRTKIMDERIRELCFEGWRRFDLIRTGKFVELISERNRWASESDMISDIHMRYPIPNVEIKQNPNFNPEDQNPGY
ncbi:MAG: RagB/SusD family nutrient uptake outer membrane protein [Bacteroidales bacterium]|nr:RagB/SusD family nutrient uptake outer membrane protein [Bacteroidales bacterium]MBN2698765.1 RagB/SusD family nutrient uptake outer membrane protein [Bacteroidales bacterium]